MYSPVSGRVTVISNRPFASETAWPTVRLPAFSAIAVETRLMPMVVGSVPVVWLFISTVAVTVV